MSYHSDNLSKVKDYYNTSTRWYRWFYYDRESLALHYGLWTKPNISRKEALINQYVIIRDLLNPKAGELILDAGCGVGGASLWLAEKTAANYVGITISEIQLQLANRYAQERNLGDRATFQLGNYFDTKFKNGTFDKIFAIESFCHAYPNPKALCAEMYRILKPGGTMVVSDGTLLRHPQDQDEEKLAGEFCRGFKMAGWNTPEEIVAAFQAVGFSSVHYINKTKEIKKSVADIWWRATLVSPLRVFKYIGLVTKTEEEQLLATRSQKEMYERGLFGYGIFVASKL